VQGIGRDIVSKLTIPETEGKHDDIQDILDLQPAPL
jgi:hypothetical protein